MKRFVKISLIVIICLVLAVFVLKYFLADRAPIPAASTYSIDLAEVKKLASASGAALPTEVRAVEVAEGAFPSWVVVAGDWGDDIPMAFVAYQIVYPDKTVIIDAAADKAAFDKMSFSPMAFDEKKYEMVQGALKKASLILITHEHYDHLGGIATSPYLKEILPHLLLTREQVDSFVTKDVGFPAGALSGYKPLVYDKYCRVAPGIVLIKSPGHTPGGQMVYVLLGDGREYLFIGDVVWNRENLKREVNRAPLASLMMREDLSQARGEIRWFIDNLYKNPKNTIIYVVSHDKAQLTEYFNSGAIKEGFK